eukprot:scaffold323_cov139-Skeletonema_menzelii.AAC.3
MLKREPMHPRPTVIARHSQRRAVLFQEAKRKKIKRAEQKLTGNLNHPWEIYFHNCGVVDKDQDRSGCGTSNSLLIQLEE